MECIKYINSVNEKKKISGLKLLTLNEIEEIKGCWVHREYELNVFKGIICDLEKDNDNNTNMNCPHCGTTEMLCGHNGVGCSSENKGDDDDE